MRIANGHTVGQVLAFGLTLSEALDMQRLMPGLKIVHMYKVRLMKCFDGVRVIKE
jgi:hypothetical protein